MAKSLVIVESPTKARTLGRFLGRKYDVKASMGHVRDLPQKALGVDVEHGFAPRYVLTGNGRKVVKSLRAACDSADNVYLATDPDREGEAIAWHLQQVLDRNGKQKFQRVVFHEITEGAIHHAFEEPRSVDARKVEAQQARRILDRIVGYQVSPLLWRNIQTGTSAGRVQSVALRLVCEREREIQAFEPKEYWNLVAHFRFQNVPKPLISRLFRLDGKKPDIGTGELAAELAEEIEGCSAFSVNEVGRKPKTRRPAPPFITSTLQQAAGSSLRMQTRRTMQIAQQLYEGVEIAGEGAAGLITYMRTDSVNIAKEAREEARAFVTETFGKDYVPARPNRFRSGKGAQEAHEAIRPTDVRRTPEAMRPHLTPEQHRLYRLIWRRFLASQMAPAKLQENTVDIQPRATDLHHDYIFRTSATSIVFPGFLKAYDVEEELDANPVDDGTAHVDALPDLPKGTPCDLEKLERKQSFTQPPPRFSEATLVGELQRNGIGRPSTYATIVTTIQQREYVNRQKGRLHPTDLGMSVNDYLVGHLDQLFRVDFTAEMESKLDTVEAGSTEWDRMLAEFYRDFCAWTAQVGTVGVPSADDATRFLALFDNPEIQWLPPETSGRRTFDHKEFLASLRDQITTEKKSLSERQWNAAIRVAARYVDQLPGLEALCTELGAAERLRSFREKNIQEEKVRQERQRNGESCPDLDLLHAFQNVTAWQTPPKTTAKTNNGKQRKPRSDKTFVASLTEQVERGKILSDRQRGAACRLLERYRDQIPKAEELLNKYSDKPPEPPLDESQRNHVQALLALTTEITEWKAAPANSRSRRARTDDREFVSSLTQQFGARGRLSDRQLAALKKLLCRYAQQIADFETRAGELGIDTSPSTAKGESSTTKEPPKQIDRPCPQCGGPLLERRARRTGKTFYGCSTFPKCRFTANTLEEIDSAAAQSSA